MLGVEGITKIPELRRRILFTLAMLAIYRLGIFVPTPGIDAEALSQFFQQAQGTILGFFNLFSGGALEKFSIFALGIMPYISVSIILSLLKPVIPHLEALSKEGELGHRKITRYTRYGTVLLCLFQAILMSTTLENIHQPAPVVLNPGLPFKLMTAITLTTGTAFIMWLGEQINERGIGNGISMIIFAGIAARIPSGFMTSIQFVKTGEWSFLKLVLIFLLMVAIIGVIIFMETGQRRIPVQYARRVVGRKMYGGQSTHLPLKINTSGVIPPIFASSLIAFPMTAATFITSPFMETIKGSLDPSGILYNVLYVGLIMFFSYFYTAIQFNPQDVSENMQKSGGFIPGIRPGRNTAEYIDRVLTRITLAGGIYLAAVCVLPTIFYAKAKVPFYFGGTSLLILIGVALDTIQQIEAHLLTRHYEGFMKHARMRGRRG